MVICFEEKDRAVIESKGMMVIEFKRKVYELGKTINNDWQMLKEKIDKIIDKIIEKFLEAMDSIRMKIEVIKDIYHYPTSQRYKIVKIFSKYTKSDMLFWWKFTWKIKRWLARSCC